jgi:hypothetical protein
MAITFGELAGFNHDRQSKRNEEKSGPDAKQIVEKSVRNVRH